MFTVLDFNLMARASILGAAQAHVLNPFVRGTATPQPDATRTRRSTSTFFARRDAATECVPIHGCPLTAARSLLEFSVSRLFKDSGPGIGACSTLKSNGAAQRRATMGAVFDFNLMARASLVAPRQGAGAGARAEPLRQRYRNTST